MALSSVGAFKILLWSKIRVSTLVDFYKYVCYKHFKYYFIRFIHT